MARSLSVHLLTLALLCSIGSVLGAADAFNGDSQAGIASNAVAQRQLLQTPTIPPKLPPINSLPINITNLLNTTRPYDTSSINQTQIIAQLRIPANLTAILGPNLTTAYVQKLVGQTLPLVLACSSNVTDQLYVCYKTWQSVFNVSYRNATEENYRFPIFVNNTRALIAQNTGLVNFFTTANKTQITQLFLEEQLPTTITTLLNSTTLLGFNKYNDRTIIELGRRYSGALPDEPNGVNATVGNSTIGGFNTTAGARRMLLQSRGGSSGGVSWIKYSNEVRQQGTCGFCWVFAVTGSLEIINNIVAKSVKYAFSEQEIVDCLGAPCDQGGFAQWSSWVPKNKLWQTQQQAPYEEDDGSKSQCPSGSPGSWFKDLVQCKYSWTDWKKVLDVQPTLFYVYADDDFTSLQGNVLWATQCDSQRTNHVMVAVGYDTYTSSSGDVYEYIIFRNSWGDSWGAEGYGKFAMTKNGKDLQLCGTTTTGIQFHTNPGLSLPSLSGCKTLALSNDIES